MLFDLRSRGRRTTVRGVYLGLAILIGGGLILFGVGTGVGGGGLLNALNGNGGSASQAVSSAERNAEKAVKTHPNSPSAWASLLQARWDTAKGTDFSATTGTFTAAGRRELAKTVQAWQKYLTLTSHPDPLLAIIAARAYTFSTRYGDASSAWEIVTGSQPKNANAFGCLAATSYAAGDTRKGDLATANALQLLPKTSRSAVKSKLSAAKASATTAKQLAQGC